jgi:hypothetical protein
MKKITKHKRFCEWESEAYLSNFIRICQSIFDQNLVYLDFVVIKHKEVIKMSQKKLVMQ